jgi:hypothetical protein
MIFEILDPEFRVNIIRVVAPAFREVGRAERLVLCRPRIQGVFYRHHFKRDVRDAFVSNGAGVSLSAWPSGCWPGL